MVQRRKNILASIVLASLATAASAADLPPNDEGPVKLLSCGWLGGPGEDRLVGAEVLPDGTLLLAGDSTDLGTLGAKAAVLANSAGAAPPPRKGKGGDKADAGPRMGFVVRLSADGQKVVSTARFGMGVSIEKVKSDPKGRIFILGNAPGGMTGAAGTGKFLAVLSPDATKVTGAMFHDGASDFGVDSNGEVVILSGASITRYAADGRTKKWTATWKSHGGNRPGGIAVSPTTGVTAICGYGMTHTGKEPYKDPYAYGFDRNGKQVWMLWNPDPGLQKDAKFGGNGLMADTTGMGASSGPDGKIYLMLRADGGNSVCTRDPADPSRKLDPEVFSGVYQGGPGYGFKGASMTSVVFRVNPADGKLEKGTWMCAWVTRGQANGFKINELTAEESGGYQFLTGGSAHGCPTRMPWYVAPEGGYKGGGVVAVFDREFKMLQCGYFPGTDIDGVSYRKGLLLVSGSAKKECVGGDKAAGGADIKYPVPIYKGVQGAFGGGERDGWYALFKVPTR